MMVSVCFPAYRKARKCWGSNSSKVTYSSSSSDWGLFALLNKADIDNGRRTNFAKNSGPGKSRRRRGNRYIK